MKNFYGRTLKVIWALGLDIGSIGGKHLNKVLWTNLILVLMNIVQQFIFIYDVENNFIDRLTIVPCIFNATLAFFKFVNSIRCKNRIQSVMENMNKLHEEMDTEEKEILARNLIPLRKVSIAFGVGYVALGSIFNFAPLLNMLQIFLTSGNFVLLHPYFAWFPIDWNEYYFSTYLYQFYFVQIAACISVIFDMLYTMILCLIIAHYAVLGDAFNRLVDGMNAKPENNKRFIHLVETQLTLHQQCDELNKIYGFTFLIHVLVVSITICFTGFVVVTQRDIFTLANNFTFLATVLNHTFVLCWFGGKIETEVIFEN